MNTALNVLRENVSPWWTAKRRANVHVCGYRLASEYGRTLTAPSHAVNDPVDYLILSAPVDSVNLVRTGAVPGYSSFGLDRMIIDGSSNRFHCSGNGFIAAMVAFCSRRFIRYVEKGRAIREEAD